MPNRRANNPNRALIVSRSGRRDESAGAHRRGVLGDLGVGSDDPALLEIARAASVLRTFGYDMALPEVAQRAVEEGRKNYQLRIEQERTDHAALAVARDVVGQVATVYYMRIGNRVKIGYSTNLDLRVATINPEELMATEVGDMKTERQRHEQFKQLRTHSEWFRLEYPLTDHIAALQEAQSAGEVRRA